MRLSYTLSAPKIKCEIKRTKVQSQAGLDAVGRAWLSGGARGALGREETRDSLRRAAALLNGFVRAKIV